MTDSDGAVTAWGQGAQAMLGWTEDEALGRPVSAVLTAEERGQQGLDAEAQADVSQASVSQRGGRERRCRTKHGAFVWARSETTPLRDENGAVRGYATILRDATEQDPAAPRSEAGFLESVLASSADCIAVLDLQAGLVFMTGAGQRLMELSGPHAARGQPWPALWREHEAEAEAAVEAARAGGTGRFHATPTAAFGSRRHWEVEVTPIMGADNRPEWLLAVARDSAPWQAKQAQRQREARLSAMFMQASVGLAEISLDGQFLWINDEICRIFGRSRQQVLSANVLDITFEDDRAATRAAFAQVVADRTLASIDKRYVRPGGDLVWVNSSLTRLDDEEGQPYSVLAVVVDLSARKADEQRLRESEAMFQAIANSIDHMVWLTAPDGSHDYHNQRWHDFTGVAEGAAYGDAWLALVHPHDRDRVWADWRRCVATGEPYHIEYRLRRHSGEYRSVLGRAQPMRDEANRVIRWFGTFTDIEDIVRARELLARGQEELERLVAKRTASLRAVNERLQEEVLERGKAEEQLRQSQKMEAVGQLTGGIAHDFNNLLQSMSSSLDLMQTRLAQGRAADLNRYLDVATTSVRRASALTQRLLAFGRRQALDPKPVNVNRLVAGLEDLVRHTVGAGTTAEYVLSGGLWSTMCDQNQLENAVLNLVINAHDAMPDGGRLTIETANVYLDDAYARAQREPVEPGQYVLISVTDTGVGMPPEVVAHAFEPFYTTKPPGQGTGLGLSMLHGFVRQSRGHARIHSEEGRGTTVRLYLPRHLGAGADADPATESSSARPGGAGETVLVVEDEGALRMLMVETLQDLEYRVLEAADGPAALLALRSAGQIDLLLTDVGLPGMTGRQLADAAREQQPGLKVLLITGYPHDIALGKDKALGPGMSLIGKPFALATLAAKVRTMVER